MTSPNTQELRVGYVVKRYPRFSETFIVNEVIAHEAAGLPIEIFSVRPCNDVRFQERISLVKAPVTRLPAGTPKSSLLLQAIRRNESSFPTIWEEIAAARFADAVTIYQAVLLAEAVVERNINHLHAHFATLPAAVARLAARIAGISYSITAHAKDIFHESVNKDEFRQKINDADAVITVSDFNVRHLADTHNMPSDRLHRVYNGIDLAHLPFAAIQPRKPVIFAVGRLVPKKGFADLIKTCGILRDRNVDFSCTIIGDGDLAPGLHELIGDLQLIGQVTMLGPQPQETVKSFLRSSAIHAAPCVISEDGDRDGLPTVLLEAMATGTPCVSTTVTGIPEVIRHEETGLIAEQNNPESLAVALERLLGDADLQNHFAANARKLIEDSFDCHKTSLQIRDVFEQCVASQRACGSDAKTQIRESA